jgi:tetratricopeptide (TPR) repeat protein
MFDGFIAYATGALFTAEHWRGGGLLDLEQYDFALDSFNHQRTYASTPAQMALAEGNRALALAFLGRGEEALAAAERALACVTGPYEKCDILSVKAFALRVLGRHEESLAVADALLAVAPFSGDGLLDRAAALANLGRNDEALAAGQVGLFLEPDLVHGRRVREHLALLRTNPATADAYAELVQTAEDELATALQEGLEGEGGKSESAGSELDEAA